MLAAVLWIIILLGLACVIVLLGFPVIGSLHERLRIDAERRAAEAQLQRITSEALLRLIREGRPRE